MEEVLGASRNLFRGCFRFSESRKRQFLSIGQKLCPQTKPPHSAIRGAL